MSTHWGYHEHNGKKSQFIFFIFVAQEGYEIRCFLN